MNEPNHHIIRLRAIAIAMVVLLHAAAPVRDQWHVMHDLNWMIGAFLDGFGRSGVPLFIMISGALLLPLNEDWKHFYRKRFRKILGPMFIFSLGYLMLWDIQTDGEIYWKRLPERLFAGPSYYHLWYLWMLLALLLITPFLRVLVQHLNKKQLEWLVLIWVLFYFIEPIISLSISYWAGYAYSIGINLQFPGLYPGYFILGYYLVTYGLPIKITRHLFWIVLVTFIQTSITAILYWANNNYTPFMQANNSITVLIQALLVWDWLKGTSSKPVRSWVNLLAGLSFTIYLLHPFVLEMMHLGVGNIQWDAKSADTILSIPLSFIMTLLITGGLAYVLKLLRLPSVFGT